MAVVFSQAKYLDGEIWIIQVHGIRKICRCQTLPLYSIMQQLTEYVAVPKHHKCIILVS